MIKTFVTFGLFAIFISFCGTDGASVFQQNTKSLLTLTLNETDADPKQSRFRFFRVFSKFCWTVEKTDKSGKNGQKWEKWTKVDKRQKHHHFLAGI
jgi:hypothetical protein